MKHSILILLKKGNLPDTGSEPLFPGTQQTGDLFLALARALASDPFWREMPDVSLIVRTGPSPILAAAGLFDLKGEGMMGILSRYLEGILSKARYVAYSKAERLCEVLAERLLDRFGREELGGFRFTSIPRGGLIVLGMLSYVLGLKHSQIEGSFSSPHYPAHAPPDRPLVIVDDCALTGARFSRFLKTCESPRVVFAHLFSHPDLRSSITARESRVIDCLAAEDLRDHAPEQLGQEYASWKEEYLSRSEGMRYWAGIPDHVCFPWNEPDRLFLNPHSGREERLWRIAPPEFCLKNRSNGNGKSIPVHVQPVGRGPLVASDRALFSDFGGRTMICDLKTGTSFLLDEVATDMWRAILELGNMDDAHRELAGSYDVDEATLAADLEGFTDAMLAQGFLEKKGDGTDGRQEIS